jgi:catechol 2,3-dioxygenase-like lactoylglutathione lyase family enzyme
MAVQMKLELVPLPVTDIDRAKAFYQEKLGFVEDVDVRPAEGLRVVQLTPPGSSCSVGLGTGFAAYGGEPGSVRALHLVVADIEQARQSLLERGVDVGDIEGDGGGGVRFAGFSDPDGNGWVLQEMSWRTGDSY